MPFLSLVFWDHMPGPKRLRNASVDLGFPHPFLFLFYLQPFLQQFIGEETPINAGRKVEDRKESVYRR
jgi:hypothetical protein